MPDCTGENCSISCPYPYYGVDCQILCTCTCSSDLCDSSIGCMDVTTINWFYLCHNMLTSHYLIKLYVKIILLNQ